MSTPFLGEVRMFGGNFAPQGWAFCSGQLLPISENDALFVLLGTTYGGDGQNTFALPDLRSRVPVHQNGSYPIGQASGTESVSLTTGQLPSHVHGTQGTTAAATSSNPSGSLPAAAEVNIYAPSSSTPVGMAPTGNTGSNQSHENRMPYLAISFIIALQGIFPSRN